MGLARYFGYNDDIGLSLSLNSVVCVAEKTQLIIFVVQMPSEFTLKGTKRDISDGTGTREKPCDPDAYDPIALLFPGFAWYFSNSILEPTFRRTLGRDHPSEPCILSFI